MFSLLMCLLLLLLRLPATVVVGGRVLQQCGDVHVGGEERRGPFGCSLGGRE